MVSVPALGTIITALQIGLCLSAAAQQSPPIGTANNIGSVSNSNAASSTTSTTGSSALKLVRHHANLYCSRMAPDGPLRIRLLPFAITTMRPERFRIFVDVCQLR